MEQLTTTQVSEIIEDITDLLVDYIQQCEKLPSKFECYECGRAGDEHFTCGCERPQVDEYKQCPMCGEWVEVNKSVWTCCFKTHVVCSLDGNETKQRVFIELLDKLLDKAKADRPVGKSLGDVMIGIMCSAYEFSYENENELKEVTDFVNGNL